MSPESETFRRVYYELMNAKNGTRWGLKKSPRFDGGRDTSGRFHNPVWPKVAAKLTDREIDIESYLEEIIPRKEITHPRDAVKDEYIQEYLHDSTRTTSDALALWNIEEKELVQMVHNNRLMGDTHDLAMRRAIADPALSVSPLVRYCFARLNGYSDAISASLAKEAMNQYIASKRVYDKVCPERIPDWWRSIDVR